MKVAVMGGTGLVGRRLVSRLLELGHEALAASRSTGVDARTGRGVEQVLEDVDVIVDVSNSGYSGADEMRRFFEESGDVLIAAERQSGIAHHVTLSAVGVGRVGSGYFRAKAAQEEIVAASGIPFTIIRSTPFFEFIYNIVDAGGDGGEIRLPPVLMQPIAADDVARALSCIALRPPTNSVLEIGGPDAYRLPSLAEEILTANEDLRRVVVDMDAPYFGARIGDEPLTIGHNPRFAPTTFEDWLRQSLVPAFARCPGRSPELAPLGARYRETGNA